MKAIKKPVERFELDIDGDALTVGFVPLCAPKRVCPKTMMEVPPRFTYCPYCGSKLIFSNKALVVE
jgi:hypothetical protein